MFKTYFIADFQKETKKEILERAESAQILTFQKDVLDLDRSEAGIAKRFLENGGIVVCNGSSNGVINDPCSKDFFRKIAVREIF